MWNQRPGLQIDTLPNAPITLATPRFNISIAPSSCLATSSYRGPDGALLTSSPVPLAYGLVALPPPPPLPPPPSTLTPHRGFC